MKAHQWALIAACGHLARADFGLPGHGPLPAPAYMVDNSQGNTHHAAPDKGSLNGPVLTAMDLADLTGTTLSAAAQAVGATDGPGQNASILAASASNYWYPGIAHGISPHAPGGYKVYRNVMDYGAANDGMTDATVAINRAISDGNRCGQNCGSTTVTYAVVYFPPGTYLISAPLVQYYFTQFVGDAANPPTIKGAANFKGIALIDNDPYIPGGNGAQWYTNQNQFYRSVRNFFIDLTAMPNSNVDNGQTYVPTGIHWQVAQATNLQNIVFNMRDAGTDPQTAAVGIMMENGSGGMVNSLVFNGGNIGFRAGSQQFTARDLTFNGCLVAISQTFDWGFTWQRITVNNAYIAIDLTALAGANNQGTGSISVVDSSFNHVPYAIPYSPNAPAPNVILDNLRLYQVPQVVFPSGSNNNDLSGPAIDSTTPQTVRSWGRGRRYVAADGSGGPVVGNFNVAPAKPAALLDSSGRWFVRNRPTYVNAPPTVVVTTNGARNDGTGDQSATLNRILANNVGKVIFFPAGIYNLQNTLFIPKGSIIVGESFSQLQGSGAKFANAQAPLPVVKVGNPGDSGKIELSDLLFTVSGATAGAILVEWNIRQSTQGSAAMWDCHFRVGGAVGSNLQSPQCPKGSINQGCKAASLLFHVTPSASGYFENNWVWVADHDLDIPAQTQISIFSARGVLIESQGPSWFYASASEHSTFYQYNLYKANNIYFGHMQTETPYYQPVPAAPQPFPASKKFNNDPNFAKTCPSGSTNCADAWAMQIRNSTNIFIYSAGFYSFFNNYQQTCLNNENCQLRLVETAYTQGLWLYNLFTVGAQQLVSPQGFPFVPQAPNQLGFTTEVSAYLVLATRGGRVGNPL